MSLIRPIIRLSAVAALRSQTWAQERVMDSDITPLVDALKDGPAKPYIVVFTDDDVRSECNGMEIYATHRDLSLTLEMGIASATVVEGEAGVQLNFPQTDASMELAIDLLEAQAYNALFGNVHNPWRELLTTLTVAMRKIPSSRGGSSDKGTRWAARQTTFVLQPLGDMVPGFVPDADHWVRRFIALAAANPDDGVHAAGQLIQKVIETDALADWRVAQAWLGLTELGMRQTAIAPFGVPEDEAPELTLITPQQQFPPPDPPPEPEPPV